MGYDYSRLLNDCNSIAKKYRFADFFSVGESVMERKILCLKLGEGKRKLFINGTHHGLETITAAFIVRFIDEFCDALLLNDNFFGYNVKQIFENTRIYFVPMVNPDGADIAVNGIDISNPVHKNLIDFVGIENFSKVWQANANGVDINHNYDAGWRVINEYPSPSRYSGPYAESEPETKAVVNFVRSEQFDMLIAFHSQGREIYYDFQGKSPQNSIRIARKFSNVSGYEIAVPDEIASFGGCKDWFIKEFKKPGFTIEMGAGINPLPDSMLEDIFEENAKIILCAADYLGHMG